MTDSAAQAVCQMFLNAGHEIYFVGGCVRNAILGVDQSDVDLSTDARPEQVMELAAKSGLKAVPTGVEHGTVTIVAHDSPFEVTTFRRDVETDGRRAVVAFSDKIEEDALRRDFTMNALYARPDGTIVDPLGGLADTKARRLTFIQDARARIREDYLRSLRYFRFWAHYARQEDGFDPETLSAVADTLDGLETLSAERVGAEMLKLLAAPDPARAVATMEKTGVLARVLPVQSTQVLPVLVHLEDLTGTPPSPIRRLACLGPDDPVARLRLSKHESRSLENLTAHTGTTYTAKALGFLLGESEGWDVCLLRSASLAEPLSPNLRADVAAGSRAEFPVQASDLMPKLQGPDLGRELTRLRELWLNADLSLSRDALLG